MKVEYKNKEGHLVTREENLSLWQVKSPPEHTIYTVCDTNAYGEKRYVTIYGKIGGYTLKPVEALELYQGESLTIDMPIIKGEGSTMIENHYPCTLVARGAHIQEKQKDGKIYSNHVLKVGAAYHMERVGDKTVYAYKCDGERFFVKNNLGHFTAILSPADCFSLKDNGAIQQGMHRVEYTGVEERKHMDSLQKIAQLRGEVVKVKEGQRISP